MKLLSFIFLLINTGVYANDNPVSFHNLPSNPVEAYNSSTQVFIGELISIENLDVGQTANFKIVQQIKGKGITNNIFIKNGRLALGEDADFQAWSIPDSPFFYLGFTRVLGKINMDITINFKLKKNKTYIVMFTPYGLHQYSFIPIDSHPSFYQEVLSKKRLVPKEYSFKELAPYFEYIYEVDCAAMDVVNLWVPNVIDIKPIVQKNKKDDIIKQCSGYKLGTIFLFGMLYEDSLIMGDMKASVTWVFPNDINLAIEPSLFWPFNFQTMLKKNYQKIALGSEYN